jgi:esterase/lipase
MEEPSKVLLGLEGLRGIYEYGLAWALNIPLHHVSPKGDGHPVLIIPGLGGADGSTHYLRNFLEDLGYEAFPWGQGRNLGPRKGMDEMATRLTDLVESISRDTGGQQVSIIGWSLGGIYGREIAKLCPDVVRQVITLGTPFKMNSGGTNAERLYEFLSKDKSHKDPAVLQKLEQCPPVPFTSIYSKTDGVVHWQCSIEDEGAEIENIEIPGASHLGLGHNPISMYVIADRLTQTREHWQPYAK